MFYYIYGDQFVENTFLYHLKRVDHRHNFSTYFYSLYFFIYEESKQKRNLLSLLSFFPSFFVQIVVVRKLAQKDFLLCCFFQMFLFVAFNKVFLSLFCLLVLMPFYLGYYSSIFLMVLLFSSFFYSNLWCTKFWLSLFCLDCVGIRLALFWI